MTSPALAVEPRPGRCRGRGPNHASRRTGSGRSRCGASPQVRRHERAARVGGSRFLQTDPIPGGSANAYDYVYQDPINKFDLDGRCWGCHWLKKHWKGVTQGALAAGCIVASAGACMVASLVVAAATNVRHDHGRWGFDKTGFAIDAGLAIGGGFAARWASGSWTESAFQRFGKHEAGYAKHALRQSISWGNTRWNMGANGGLFGAGAAAGMWLHHRHFGDD